MPASRIRDIVATRSGVQARLITAGGDSVAYGA